MAEFEQLIWFVLPIVVGAILGLVIGWLMRKRWRVRIDLQLKQESEIKDLVTSE